MKTPYSDPGARWGIAALLATVCLLLPALSNAQAKGPRPANAKRAAVASSSSAQSVDTALIRKLYMDGDFEQAIEILEADLKKKEALDHTDSVFIFKHLGVMYAARYETRELGKRYMHQLLMTEPTAKIMDMYASDMIYMIFKNIQDEFDTTRRRLTDGQGRVDDTTQTGPNTPATGVPKTSPPKSGNSHVGFWIGAGVIAAGVGGYFLYLGLTGSDSQNHSF